MPIPKKIEPPIDLNGFPDTYLRQRDFNQLVYKRGYPVYIDRFMNCPCQEKGTNSARVTCKNCFGTGWVLAERIQTVAMIASINMSTQYKEWSLENIGTVQITTLSRDPVNFMDRVVLYEEESIYSELIYPRYLEEGGVVAFCAYPPIEILNLKVYQSDTEALKDLDISQVEIDKEGKIILTNSQELFTERGDYIYEEHPSISIRYKYHPSYHVIDVNRNMIVSPTDTPLGSEKKGTRVEFPYSAMGRQSHLVIERGNLKDLPEGMINNLNIKETTSLFDQVKDTHTVSKEFCETEK